MDYLLDSKVIFSEESEYKSLYKWCLRELDETGKQIGRDQIPWNWGLNFTATEFALTEELKLEMDMPLLERLNADKRQERAEVPMKTEERQFIRAELRPGHFGDPDEGERYSMLGTKRPIKSFALYIYELENNEKQECCLAWGTAAYKFDNDFRTEVADDVVQFYLHVSSKRFAHYVEMVRHHPASYAIINVHSVDGFYSEWSPAVSTDRIKVLANIKDQKVVVPEDLAFKIPELGRIGEFSLTFVTRKQSEKPPRSVEQNIGEPSDEPQLSAQTPEEEGVLLQRAALKLGAIHQRQIKHLAYAAWATVVLLLLLLAKGGF